MWIRVRTIVIFLVPSLCDSNASVIDEGTVQPAGVRELGIKNRAGQFRCCYPDCGDQGLANFKPA